MIYVRVILLRVTLRLAQVLMMPDSDEGPIARTRKMMRILCHRFHVSLQICPLQVLQLIYSHDEMSVYIVSTVFR